MEISVHKNTYISLVKIDDNATPGFPSLAPARPFSAPGSAFRPLFAPSAAPTTHKASIKNLPPQIAVQILKNPSLASLF